MIEVSDLYEEINLVCLFLIRALWARFIKVPPLPILAFPQSALVGCVLPSHPSFTVHVPPPHFWTELDPSWNELNIFVNILAYQKSFLHDVRLKALHETFKNDQLQSNVAKRSDQSWQQYTILMRTIQFGIACCNGLSRKNLEHWSHVSSHL